MDKAGDGSSLIDEADIDVHGGHFFQKKPQKEMITNVQQNPVGVSAAAQKGKLLENPMKGLAIDVDGLSQ